MFCVCWDVGITINHIVPSIGPAQANRERMTIITVPMSHQERKRPPREFQGTKRTLKSLNDHLVIFNSYQYHDNKKKQKNIQLTILHVGFLNIFYNLLISIFFLPANKFCPMHA